LESAILAILREYDREALTEQQQVHFDTYDWYLDDLVRGHEFMYHDYPVHHFLIGYQDEIVGLFASTHRVTSLQDAEDYISRLSQVKDQVDQLIEGLTLRQQAGVVPPRFVIQLVTQGMRDYLSWYSSDPSGIDLESLSVYTVFRTKLNDIPDLEAEDRQELLEAALAEIEASFVPGYLALLYQIEQLESNAGTGNGVWQFPDGDSYYAHMLRRESSTDLTPDQIHQLGLSEVARIQAEMRSVFDELGYPEDEGLAASMNHAITEAGGYDTSSPTGGDEVIQAYEEILTEVDQELGDMFGLMPAADVVVIGESSFGGGGGYYNPGSVDGSRPGAFHTGIACCWVPRYRMKTIAYHEALPGHHFQIAVAQEQDLPTFMNDIIFNAYVEGWALYAERLGWELGLYDDPYSNLGRLHLELLRAVRLVTDTGVHALRWTRSEAKAYMTEAMGDANSTHEVDRYLVLPGQATGYKIGMLKILELRQRAMDELGDRFDIKQFHDTILGSGSVPLEVLERIVLEYIESEKG
jgi:uncharacterized protein (DUF885 family)